MLSVILARREGESQLLAWGERRGGVTNRPGSEPGPQAAGFPRSWGTRTRAPLPAGRLWGRPHAGRRPENREGAEPAVTARRPPGLSAGSTMLLRETSLMPHIPGLPALLSMLFAPVMELR